MLSLVKSLTHIKATIADPSMQVVLGNLAPQLLTLLHDDTPNTDLDDAKKGLPASSKPAGGSVPASSKPAGGSVPASSKPAGGVPTTSVLSKTSSFAAEPTPTPADSPAARVPEKDTDEGKKKTITEVNSSTHRAAHARLARRMERAEPTTFPNMVRLWSGNRKE